MGNTLFGMMNSSTSGLMTSQAAVNITGNNILNANTIGYTRQRVVFGSQSPIYFRGQGYMGTGVEIQDVQRIRDSFLDEKIQKEFSTLSEYEAKHEILSEIETIFNEPSDTGLNQLMTDMWNSWEELSKNADNSTMQALVKETSQAVADQLKHFQTQLDKTLENVQDRQDGQIKVANELIAQVNELNGLLEKAYKNDPTTTPNELLDQRDLLMKQISEYMPIDVKVNENHTVSISMTTSDNQTVDVLGLDEQKLKDLTPTLKSGSLKGYEDSKADIAEYQKNLNEYAKALGTEINTIHEAAGGEPIFIFDENDAAGTITVNPDLKDIVAGTDGTGDGSVALDILGLRDQMVTIDGKETKFDQFYKDMIGDLGVKAQHAESMVEGQEVVLNYLLVQEESISGVSIDEEAVNLIQYQKAYDANAKVISTITEMLDTVINGLGA